MSPPRFPRTPEVDRGPFDDGSNPFRDGDESLLPNAADVFASPAAKSVQPYSPGTFEVTQYDRSPRLLVLAGIGAFLVGLSALIVGVVIAQASIWSEELAYCLPTDLLGLAFSIPALVMSRADLRAVRAGVMALSGYRRTRAAYWISLVAVLVGLAPVGLALFGIILAVIS